MRPCSVKIIDNFIALHVEWDLKPFQSSLVRLYFLKWLVP